MSRPENLKDLYVEELQDLWSANDQMERVVKKFAGKASDPGLQAMFEKSRDGIARHTETIKQLLSDAGAKTKSEHCRGMEGLATEAQKHALDDGPKSGPARDAVMISQYQRMSHYGIAGFGTVASYAGTLEMPDAEATLKRITAEIYGADEYATKLAETSVNLKAEMVAA